MIKILTVISFLSMYFQELLTFLTMSKKLTVYRIRSIYDNHIYFLSTSQKSNENKGFHVKRCQKSRQRINEIYQQFLHYMTSQIRFLIKKRS